MEGTIAQRYRAAFETYLRDGSEQALGAAYELGRSAVGSGRGILELADAHHAAMRDTPANGRPEQEVAAAAADFFRESLATFEIALRGFAEAHQTARLESEHARRQELLAEASLALYATLSTERILAVAVAEARRILEAERAEIAVELAIRTPGTAHGVAARSGAGSLHVLQASDPEGAGPADPGPRVATPLSARDGGVTGTLAVSGSRRPTSEQEPVLVQLAQMTSVAIENAQRYAREREVAQTLQRSLLPGSLPRIPGIELAARFAPAGDGIQVGGDFYDVFRTGAGDWLAVIGDVCGKGPEAAALTALTRYTIRAAALHEREPSRILAVLNEAMLDQRRDGRFATVLCLRLVLGPGGARVVTSSGGHPLPLLLRANGRVDAVGAGGTLLGVVDRPVLSSSELELVSGDTLLLYTDGVIEVRARGEELFGADDLSALLEDNAGAGAETLLERIEQGVLQRSGGRPQDDVALLALRVL